MRIDRLTLKNFKCFAEQSFDLHPQLTLFVGDNGSGKTSILEGLAIAAGSWLLGVGGYKTPQIRRHQARLEARPVAYDGSWTYGGYTWEEYFPCEISAAGHVLGQPMEWRRALTMATGRTTYKDARELKDLARRTSAAARDGNAVLPLIASYGTCRLCDTSRDQASVKDERPLTDKTKMSRFSGYHSCMAQRADVASFVRWIARQTWIGFQQGGRSSALFGAVQHDVASCMPGALGIHFDPTIGEVVVDFGERGQQPFNNLSEGQRSMLALVGDIATKAATLNPQLGAAALSETPGIVLIDELDLHLHPKWQRRVATDLKRIFKSLQFVCATHSPQIVGELSREEVRLLRDGEARWPAVARGADSNWILDHVMEGAASETEQARKLRDAVDEALDEGDLQRARRQLTELRELIDGDTGALVGLESYLRRLERLAATSENEDEL